MRKLLLIFPVLLLLVFHSCSNKDIEFDDFDYQTIYFAYQYPIRTITLGEDFVDTSMDNDHKFQIMATLGGVYSNKKDVTVNFVVDNTLSAGHFYKDSSEIKTMPSNYYQLAANSLTIPKGSVVGGVEVQLTEDFFQDPLAVNTNYVIPIRIESATNVDSILSGVSTPIATDPKRLVLSDWEIQPKDFTLYAVKYVNPWHGNYLRRGVDVVSGAVDSTIVRHERYVEEDQVILLSTTSMTAVDFPIKYQDEDGNDIPSTLRLTFDNEGKFVISSPSNDYSATGEGKFVKQGEKNSWGSKDRDALYLKYEIDFGTMKVVATDTLVLRNRGVGMEVFEVLQEE